jgi:hypothetical protein
MTYAFTIAELRHHDVKALPDGAEYTGNKFAGNRNEASGHLRMTRTGKDIIN